jgi:hypothetical protein
VCWPIAAKARRQAWGESKGASTPALWHPGHGELPSLRAARSRTLVTGHSSLAASVVAASPQVKIILDNPLEVQISYVLYMAWQINHMRTLNWLRAWRSARAASPQPFVIGAGSRVVAQFDVTAALRRHVARKLAAMAANCTPTGGIMPRQKAKDNGRGSRQRFVGLRRSLVRNLSRTGYYKMNNIYDNLHIT